MEPRLSMLALGVADLSRSIAFYRDGLGWTLCASGNAHIAFFQLAGGVVLSLYPRALLAADAGLPDAADGVTAARFSGVTLAQNVRSMAEVDSVLWQAEQAGGRLLKPAATVFWGGYSGYFADPDGHPWEICFNPKIALQADGRLLMP